MSRPLTTAIHPECAPILGEGRIVVLGLSGGRDSIALLHLLRTAGCAVYAMHLHHGYRGAAADADAQFCQDICEQWGVHLTLLHEDVPTLAQQAGISFEQMGRKLRRAHLGTLACVLEEKYLLEELPPIVLAHHADDQAETVIFNVCRGASGLRGMHAYRQQEIFTYLRPLLHWRREEITQYLTERQIPWRDDETNAALNVTRNALRHQAIPLLTQIMGRDIVPILSRGARVQQDSAQALDEALTLLPSHDPQGRLYLPFIQRQAVPLQRAILFHYMRERKVSELSERVIDEAMELLSGERHVVNLARGRYLRRRQRRIFIDDDAADF